MNKPYNLPLISHKPYYIHLLTKLMGDEKNTVSPMVITLLSVYHLYHTSGLIHT